MWARTQICDGTSVLRRSLSRCCNTVETLSTVSTAGLTPISAAPEPRDRPQKTSNVMPRRLPVGWLGCNRDDIVPGGPGSVRALVGQDPLGALNISPWHSHNLPPPAP